ncbi:MAG: helix-turn-helix domain-containing protein [Deltaproteobacteria bacterium]|nr:helix-turn-helix domain-containing protein [Deltaproteobacteria bacterium]
MSEEKLTLGQYFRAERENRGIDLKEIEERTKISAQTLRFLEDDQIDMLPPRAFLRGFLQVISKEFDFDEEELVKYLDDTIASYGHQEEPFRRFKPGDTTFLTRTIIIVAVVFALIVFFSIAVKKCTGLNPPQGCAGMYAETVVEESQNSWKIDNYPG